MGSELVRRKVVCCINKDLVNGVNVDVLGSDVFQVNAVDIGAHPHIMRHLRLCGNEVELEGRVCGKLGGAV